MCVNDSECVFVSTNFLLEFGIGPTMCYCLFFALSKNSVDSGKNKHLLKKDNTILHL